MLVLPQQSQSFIRNQILNLSRPQHKLQSCISGLAKQVVEHPDEPAVHTLLVYGDLDTLLKFYQMYKEPQSLSQHFVYSWVASTSCRKSVPQPGSASPDNLSYELAERWLHSSEPTEVKEKALADAPIELWQKIVSFIPLNRLKCLTHLAHVWEEVTEGQITYADVIEWKLHEQSVLLFEFQSHSLNDSSVDQLPMLQGLRSFFPELSFVLRTISNASKMPINTGYCKVKLIKEQFEIFLNNEHCHITNHYQVTEMKGKTTVYRMHQFNPNQKVDQPSVLALQFLGKFQNLFREPSKMAIHRGNTAPSYYHWYALFNDNSVDALYEGTQMPNIDHQTYQSD